MNNIVQYAQDIVGRSRCSQYVDADRIILGRSMASAAGVLVQGTYNMQKCECANPSTNSNLIQTQILTLTLLTDVFRMLCIVIFFAFSHSLTARRCVIYTDHLSVKFWFNMNVLHTQSVILLYCYTHKVLI